MKPSQLIGMILSVSTILCGPGGALTASAEDVPGQLSHQCGLGANPVEASDNPLAGIFDGSWDDKLPQTVIIYRIDGKKVKTYYSHGEYEPWGIKQGRCSKHSGKIKSDGSVELKRFGNGAEVVYWLDADGQTLHGTYTRKGAITVGTFVRVN